ncbi:MAG: hypothetical protein R3D27_00445 [Hyphomicrobiaceae bacterium]
MLKIAAALLGILFVALAAVALVLHLRVTRTVRKGAFAEFRRAMRLHNYDLAETFLEPEGLADMQRLRRVSQGLMAVLIGAAALMAANLVFNGAPRAR